LFFIKFNFFVQIWFFILGAVVGSFLNMLIYRLPRGYHINLPSRSTCTSCLKQLTVLENIPILSYLFLKGRCKTCGVKIGFRAFFVEVVTAMLFYAISSFFGFSFETLFYCFFVSSLILVTFIDIDFRIIPDEVSIWGSVLLLILSHFVEELGFINSLLGALSGSMFFYFLSKIYTFFTKREGLGFGDVKLLFFIGAGLGIKGAFLTIILSSLLGSIVGIIIMIVQKKDLKLAIPYGPFLAIGAMISLFWGDVLNLRIYQGF
jgi:leader peptidase (prepilin peptidase)/N-methyltransferase